MNKESLQEKLRTLPSVEELLSSAESKDLIVLYSHPLVAKVCREVIADAREMIVSKEDKEVTKEEILSEVTTRLEEQFYFKLQPVINATGIILHTNLGRAPLSKEIFKHIAEVATNYNNLEFVLESGQRGKRGTLLEQLLSELTGAESACVVNNNAGAMFLILSALAKGKEVIVSRGELVQIGGGFRIPEILGASGAILKEVGTTNQTTIEDYEKAITENTALLLKIHHSNFKMAGFVKEAALKDLSELAEEKKLLLVYDQGSGALIDTRQFGLEKEPLVQEGVSSGADLVAFSGDKLLGGPQAGIVVGNGELINKIKSHPLYRALRPDKFTLSGLEETALLYLKSQVLKQTPIWRIISQPTEKIKQRAEQILHQILNKSAKLSVTQTTSYLGGGSLPGQGLPSHALGIESIVPLEDLAKRFRLARPPVIGRISQDRFLLDLRTVLPEQDTLLVSIITLILH
jgi:L-seryl-tRNA(Ser) seleniumtransferase